MCLCSPTANGQSFQGRQTGIRQAKDQATPPPPPTASPALTFITFGHLPSAQSPSSAPSRLRSGAPSCPSASARSSSSGRASSGLLSHTQAHQSLTGQSAATARGGGASSGPFPGCPTVGTGESSGSDHEPQLGAQRAGGGQAEYKAMDRPSKNS